MRHALATLLIACGGAPAAIEESCPGSPYRSVDGTGCALLLERAALSRVMLLDALVVTGSGIDRLRSDVRVVISSAGWDEACGGYRYGEIELCSRFELRLLLHEELHMLEVSRLTWRPEHGGWPSLWLELDERYQAVTEPKEEAP